MSDLIPLIRDHSQPLDPRPSGMEARLAKLPGHKAVIFDIYGTLFVSGSGDISIAEEHAGGAKMADVLGKHGVPVPDGGGSELEGRFFGLIREEHERLMAQGTEFPEVEIRDIWRRLIGGEGVGDDVVERIAVEYECRVNPVWPMPGLDETLEALAGRGMALGIVSNSQFYTPLLFTALADKSVADYGFSESLCVWSYRQMEGKPSKALYEEAARGLAAEGIAPGEALYVGNDMMKDVRPAAATGFRTALFAGDERSLRLRGWEPGDGEGGPDLVVTDLRQLLGAVQ